MVIIIKDMVYCLRDNNNHPKYPDDMDYIPTGKSSSKGSTI